jgi:LmbE family N-acetylglucosaminyl deacetylase
MRVLAIAAHPDDELLGLGATLARHAEAGDDVIAIVVSEGASSRYEAGAEHELQRAGRKAAEVLGLREVRFLGFPDQRLDTIPLIEITQRIEREMDGFRPDVLYTHHWGDMNRDHRIVGEAVMVAARPIGDAFPRTVLLFETPSSTEWAPPDPTSAFIPNHFVDVTRTIEKKLAAMACYESELRPAPHPRSLEALRARSQYWGQIITRPYAEAFVLARRVVDEDARR